MKYNYYLSLGSNIEPRHDHLLKALSELSSIGTIIKKSSIYETEAWGNKEQSNFYNAIVKFKSSLDPRSLITSIKRIEKSIGRKATSHWGPREIDLDIILCQDQTINDSDLKIPHPEFTRRRFILEPLLEIEADDVHVDKNKTIYEILATCEDQSHTSKLDLNW
jgi:2-amino-4-hydroxy-6-hydroxymethyldihydropteridine diphosphokinase